MHRNLGVFTGREVPLERLFAQWQGKASGFTKGRDRSFHFEAGASHRRDDFPFGAPTRYCLWYWFAFALGRKTTSMCCILLEKEAPARAIFTRP